MPKKAQKIVHETADTATKVIKEVIEDTMKIGTKGYKGIKKTTNKEYTKKTIKKIIRYMLLFTLALPYASSWRKKRHLHALIPS